MRPSTRVVWLILRRHPIKGFKLIRTFRREWNAQREDAT